MSVFDSPGFGAPQLPGTDRGYVAVLTEGQALNRVLEFTGYTIHDVVNNPVARNAVTGYYRLYRYVEWYCETTDSSRRDRVRL